MLYNEKYRPLYHFSPQIGWMNDPNGLVYFEGEYHLFYQYHPDDTVWGPMHWGHAVSTDLVHWTHLPIALSPDKLGCIFSGSAVMDEHDTSGFFGGKAGLVAIFTHAAIDEQTGGSIQRQSLAFSRDRGRTWRLYERNPVLTSLEQDFRDPKVIWHAGTRRWVMVLAVGQKVQLYSSPNLIDWQFESEFGEGEGAHDGVWECPDLIELPVGPEGQSKWVLIVSVGDHHTVPAGSRTQYFIGTFDGKRFVNENPPDTVLWLDHGRDHYAGVTWFDTEHRRKILIGWMNNWKYANRIPADGFRGSMTIPRELSLVQTDAGTRLVQQPIRELACLRRDMRSWSELKVPSGQPVHLAMDGWGNEIAATVKLAGARKAGLVLSNSANEQIIICFDAPSQTLYVDRRKSGKTDFQEDFPCAHGASLPLSNNSIAMRLFLDRCSLELFADGGKLVLTDQLFPECPYDRISFYAEGGDAEVTDLTIYQMSSIWRKSDERNGAILHYAFDEGEGRFVLDETAGVRDPIRFALSSGRYQAPKNPEWRRGVLGKALLFDGYSTYILRSGSQVRPAASGLTVSAWIAPRTYHCGDGDRAAAIVNQHDREAGEGYIVGLHRHGYLTLGLGFGGEWIELRSNEPVPNREWSFIAATYDASSGMACLYRNGRRIGEKQLTAGREIAPCRTDLLVGRHNQPVVLDGMIVLNMFDGLMDELAVLSYAKSEEELKKDYEHGLKANHGCIPPIADSELEDSRSLWIEDRHRPQFHLSPPSHWMNEPHAPFYYNGQYHLFYQYNPKGPFWHQIHWGHWVSRDLVHWRDLPPALGPEEGDLDPDGIWSGSASYDENGLPVLFYTAANNRCIPNQRVAMAFSNFMEDGDNDFVHWRKHPESIVHRPECGDLLNEFRDPFVWQEDGRWHMLVGSGLKDKGGTALLFTSDDLHKWKYRGPFFETDYEKYRFLGVAWELPVFLPVRNPDTGEEKRILLISPWGEGSDVEVYYWLGSFDKARMRFVPEHDDPRLIDLGDFHFTGPSGMVDPRTGRTLLFTIAQGERSLQSHLEAGWAHNGGLPVSLTLRDDGQLGVEPVEEVALLRGRKIFESHGEEWTLVNERLRSVRGDMLEIQVEFSSMTASRYGLSVRRTETGDEETVLIYDERNQRFEVNREKSTKDPRELTRGVQGGPLHLNGERLRLRVFVDRSLIEAYCNGLKSLTTRTYPSSEHADRIQIHSDGDLRIDRMEIWEMRPAFVAP